LILVGCHGNELREWEGSNQSLRSWWPMGAYWRR